MDERIASDARFSALAKVRQARMLSPEMKFRAGADLFEEACQWTLAGIANRFPEATEAERREKLRWQLNPSQRPRS
jgi:hypothetical protein